MAEDGGGSTTKKAQVCRCYRTAGTPYVDLQSETPKPPLQPSVTLYRHGLREAPTPALGNISVGRRL